MPLQTFTMKFMRQVLKGDKKLLKSSEVGNISVPRFREISVANLYDVVKDVPAIMMHLPDRIDGKKEPPREFCYRVVSHLNPNFIEEAVKRAT